MRFKHAPSLRTPQWLVASLSAAKIAAVLNAAILIAAFADTGRVLAQTVSPTRPRITGISHAGYFVSSLPPAIAFWHGLLGFEQSYDLKKPDTASEVRIAFIKINDHQHIELFNEPLTAPPNHMSHLCFTVSDIQQMRAYLNANGFHVPPSTGKTRTGDYAFEIKDPDGTLVEFVQTLPTGMEAQAAGRFAPPTRVSSQIYHVGFLVGNTPRALDFYGKTLGFEETWRGGASSDELSWINMRVPDGSDYVEFMLYRKLPESFGSSNHIALEVPDLDAAVAAIEARPAFKDYGKPLTIKVGRNGKRQVNLFDTDGTRVELMEPNPFDGKPVPSSTAPPPPPSHD